MEQFRHTSIWTQTLGTAESLPGWQAGAEFLRSEYLRMRERVALLVAEIPQDLREFTVHDITHLDALWEMASLAAGDEYRLTPLEGFVLGGAILLHDAGMSLAAYPEGRAALRREKMWLDTLIIAFNQKYGRRPNDSEINNPPLEVEREVISDLLRQLHAKHAEHLACISWKQPTGTETHFLIADPDLRSSVGSIIGLIAHSHWWDVSEVRRRFPIIIGAPAAFPAEWTIDPLKLACLLRVADAMHIDARRAPKFLRALRRLSNWSDTHWNFQSKLHQPHLQDDRLVYSAGSRFRLEDAAAWWLCYDTIRMIDAELRQVDSLLADTKRPRLSARGVAGADDPRRLSDWVPTDLWEPIDARLRVSDVSSLVARIGGRELYGDDDTVPIRELIQNAADAIRARRHIEGMDSSWGSITLRLGSDSQGPWLEIHDNGIGMSRSVITGPLLDFGTTYWNSSLMREEWPGLVSKGFQSVGRYGIGFFSVFMLGRKVRVTTRRFDEARKDTRVLEFSTGTASRPILRPASEDEVLSDGGTCVRVWLHSPLEANLTKRREFKTIEQMCTWLCPALDVDLFVHRHNESPKRIIQANDWIYMPGEELLDRVRDIPSLWWSTRFHRPEIRNVAPSLRLLRNPDGAVVGRAAFHDFPDNLSRGVLCVGGLRACYLQNISGILLGYPTTAARDSGLPLAEEKECIRWAEEQVQLISKVFIEPEEQQSCAALVYLFRGDPGPLVIGETVEGPLTINQIMDWARLRDKIILCIRDGQWVLNKEDGAVSLYPNVITVDSHSGLPVINSRSSSYWPRSGAEPYATTPGALAVIEAVSKAWSLTIDELLKEADMPSAEHSTVEAVGMLGKSIFRARDVIILHRLQVDPVDSVEPSNKQSS
jgi:hypothetical protein